MRRVQAYSSAQQRAVVDALERDPWADPYAAYRALSARFVVDGRADLMTIGATITQVCDALLSGRTLDGSGFTLDATHTVDGHAAILYSSADATQSLATTSNGPATGAEHSLHWTGTIQAVAPSDVGTLLLIGRQNAGASVMGIRNTAKTWWGSFAIGLQIQSSSNLTIPSTAPQLFDFTFSSGNVATLWIDGISVGTATPSPLPAWSAGYGLFSASSSFPPPDARCYRAAFFDSDIGKAGISAIGRADALAMPSMQTPSVFRAHGDSITAGEGLNAGEDWPSVAGVAINAGRYEAAVIQNAGVSGSTAASNLTMASSLAAYRPRARSSVGTIGWGSNDIALGGVSAATLIGYWQTEIAALRAQGFRPILVTLLERGSTGFYPAIAQANAWAMAQQGSLPVVPVHQLPHAANPANPTYFQDTTHPTAALAAEMGALAAPIVAGQLV